MTDKPQTRTYAGGETLPALTDSFRPVRVGQTSQGEYKHEIRAFVAVVRNRSRHDMKIKEGSNDAVTIQARENYQVIDPEGFSKLQLKGEDTGEDYEIRTVEAHNKFSLLDKVEGIIHSVQMLLQSNQQTVERPQDTAAETGDLEFFDENDNINQSNVDTAILHQNNSGEKKQVEYVTWSMNEKTPREGRVEVYIEDGNNTKALFTMKPMQFPLYLNPPLPLNPGETIKVDTWNLESGDINYFTSAVLRR